MIRVNYVGELDKAKNGPIMDQKENRKLTKSSS